MSNMTSAQEYNQILERQVAAYEAYFAGKQAALEQTNQANPHDPNEVSATDVTTPYEMWELGFEEGDNLLSMQNTMSVVNTMLTAMEDFMQIRKENDTTTSPETT